MKLPKLTASAQSIIMVLTEYNKPVGVYIKVSRMHPYLDATPLFFKSVVRTHQTFVLHFYDVLCKLFRNDFLG